MKVPSMELFGNVYSNWKNFINEFTIYISTEEFANKRDDLKVQLLLDCLGNEDYEIYKKMEPSLKKAENGTLLNKVIEKFDEHYASFKNVEEYNIFLFNTRVQKENESFDSFLKAIEEIAAYCNFGPLRKKLIKGKIISGISDADLKNTFLKIEDPSLDNIITRCKIYEELKGTIDGLINGKKNICASHEKVNDKVESPETPKKITDGESSSSKEISGARVVLQELEDGSKNKKIETEEHATPIKEIEIVKKESSSSSIKEKKFSCRRCDRNFTGEGYLKNHIASKHFLFELNGKKLVKKFKKEEIETYTCDDCGKRFTMKDNLEYHVNSHLNAKPFNCNKCSKSFFQKGEFIKHLSRKH